MKSAAKLLVLVVFLALPSLAFAGSAPQPDTPLLAALQCAASTAASAAASPLAQIGIPAVVEKTDCSATQTNCPTLCPATCTGVSSCTVQSNGVTCDGNFVPCPYASCTSTPPTFGFGACDNPCQYCACRAQGRTLIQCMPWC